MRFPEMFLKFGIPFHSSLCVGKKKETEYTNVNSSIMKVGTFGNKHPILRQKRLEMRDSKYKRSVATIKTMYG